MKLYYHPGACSLADHIALNEIGRDVDLVRVDVASHRTETGADFMEVNPKGYVPVLEFDDGVRLTENIAILWWIAQQDPKAAGRGDLEGLRLLERLAFVSTELHKQFKPLLMPTSTPEEKARQGGLIERRLAFLADGLASDYLGGAEPDVADAYLFVMLRWAAMFALNIPAPLAAYMARMADRPAVKAALAEEGLG